MEDILARLGLNDSRKTTPTQNETTQAGQEHGALEKLLTNLGDQTKASRKQEMDPKGGKKKGIKIDPDHSSGSDRATTDSYSMISCSESQSSDHLKNDATAILRMQQELEAAKSVISRQEQEIAETRTFKHTIDQAMGPASEIDFGGPNEMSESTIGHLQSAFNATARPFTSRTTGWRSQDDNRSDHSEFSAGSYAPRGIWNNQSTHGLGSMPELPSTAAMMGNPRESRLTGQQYLGAYGNQTSMAPAYGNNRVFSDTSGNGLGYDSRMADNLSMYNGNPAVRRNMPQYRSGSTLSDPLSPLRKPSCRRYDLPSIESPRCSLSIWHGPAWSWLAAFSDHSQLPSWTHARSGVSVAHECEFLSLLSLL